MCYKVYFIHWITFCWPCFAPYNPTSYRQQPKISKISFVLENYPSTGAFLLTNISYVHLYQGELVEDSSIQRSSVVTAIVWHPVRKILAIGWQSGDVLIWNEHDHELHEASSIHQSAVQVIQWSNNGNRLVTSDQVCFNEGWSTTKNNDDN